jgi:hypothetical protein
MFSAAKIAAQGGTGYNLTRSLRFRASASAYLSRTPASTTNRTTWTYSTWVKRGLLGTNTQTLLSCGDGTGNNHTSLRVYNDTILFGSVAAGSVVGNLQTNQVLRDPSAYYHLIFVWDTGNATAANRMRLYINGVQVTSFAASTNPSLNQISSINFATVHYIGTGSYTTEYFDGYLTEVNFIDGQALTPSSFGSTNSTTGVWQPARYTGTYGTNGFYLPFTDNSALTTSSNVGLGKDFSGNGNYWTTNNISITANVTYDSMTDVPTLTSSTAANFAVLNPLVSLTYGATLTNGNLNFVGTATGQHVIAQSTTAMPSGKWYAEFTLTAFGGANPQVGIIDVSTNVYTANPFIGSFALGYAYVANAQKYNNGTATSYGATYTTNDVIGVSFNTSTGSLEFFKNGTSQGVAYTGITGNYAFVVDAYNNGSWVANFGQRPFSFSPPSGFVALNSFNIPSGSVATNGSFTGNVSADGPSINLNGVPTAMTINGNAVTFGTHADKTAYGFKVRSSSTSYNSTGTNTYSVSTVGAVFKNANAQGNP